MTKTELKNKIKQAEVVKDRLESLIEKKGLEFITETNPSVTGFDVRIKSKKEGLLLFPFRLKECRTCCGVKEIGNISSIIGTMGRGFSKNGKSIITKDFYKVIVKRTLMELRLNSLKKQYARTFDGDSYDANRNFYCARVKTWHIKGNNEIDVMRTMRGVKKDEFYNPNSGNICKSAEINLDTFFG